MPVRGFVCPSCTDPDGNPRPLRVRKTTRPTSGLVVRYRLCPGCKRRVTTRERAAPPPPDKPTSH